jgi:hypothetical protein
MTETDMPYWSPEMNLDYSGHGNTAIHTQQYNAIAFNNKMRFGQF